MNAKDTIRKREKERENQILDLITKGSAKPDQGKVGGELVMFKKIGKTKGGLQKASKWRKD